MAEKSKKTEGASIIEGLLTIWPDFELSNYDQMNPTSEIVIKFYEKFICSQLQTDIHELHVKILDNATCTEAFRDTLYVYVLYMCTNILIKKVGLDSLLQDFGIKDLLKPTRKKFKMMLLLLGNCVLYTTSLQEYMEQVKNQILDRLKNIEDIKKKVEEALEKLNSYALLQAKNIESKEEWQNDKNRLINEIETLQKVVNQNNNEIKFSKDELNSVQNEYEKHEEELNKLLTLEQHLKNQIVEDPQSVINERLRLENEISQLKSESDDYEKIMNNKMQTINCYQKNRDIINQFFETMSLNKILEKYDLINEYKNTIEHTTLELKSLQAKENEYLHNIKGINDESNVWEQKIQAFLIKSANQVEKYDTEIQQLKNDFELEQEKISNIHKKSESIKKQIKSVAESCQQCEENIEKQNEEYINQYMDILRLKEELDTKVLYLIEQFEKEHVIITKSQLIEK